MSIEDDAAAGARIKTEALMRDVLACNRDEAVVVTDGPLKGQTACSCGQTMASMFYGLLLRLYRAEASQDCQYKLGYEDGAHAARCANETAANS